MKKQINNMNAVTLNFPEEPTLEKFIKMLDNKYVKQPKTDQTLYMLQCDIEAFAHKLYQYGKINETFIEEFTNWLKKFFF